MITATNHRRSREQTHGSSPDADKRMWRDLESLPWALIASSLSVGSSLKFNAMRAHVLPLQHLPPAVRALTSPAMVRHVCPPALPGFLLSFLLQQHLGLLPRLRAL
uniref:Uncharacterized protein n=1 Tax=Knipowitschia caucasica TaxID=637954 RepID=A0AAV2ML53_KNICA